MDGGRRVGVVGWWGGGVVGWWGGGVVVWCGGGGGGGVVWLCGGGVVVWWIGLGSVVGHWGGLGRALGWAGWCGQGGGDGVVQGIGVGWVGRVGEANPLMVFCIGIDDAKTMLICGQARTGVVSVCERACGVCVPRLLVFLRCSSLHNTSPAWLPIYVSPSLAMDGSPPDMARSNGISIW